LRVEPRGAQGVRARLSQAGRTIVERTLDGEAGECAELAETVALVTDSWLPMAAGAAALERAAGATARAAATARVRGEGFASVDRERAPAVRASAPAERLAAPTEPVAAPAGRRVARPLVLDFALGTALGIDTLARGASESPVALLRAGAELEMLPWHLGARAQLETPDALDPAGTLSILRGSIEIWSGVDVHRAERRALVASLAAGADLLAVTRDYSNSPGALFAPSAAAGLRGEWQAFPNVALTAMLEGVATLRRDQFRVGRDDRWYTPRVRARISIGALWHL
jgi:hypothetical protein